MTLSSKFVWKENDLMILPAGDFVNRGVTGTQHPPKGCSRVVEEWLSTLDKDRDRIINGCCTGIDEIIGRRAFERGFWVHGVVPANRSKVSRDFTRWCKTWELMDERTDYMQRNDRIVELSFDLTAFPRESIEQLRSGTWATVRRGWKKGITVTIISLEHLIP